MNKIENIKDFKNYITDENIQDCNKLLNTISTIKPNKIYSNSDLIKNSDLFVNQKQTDNLYNDVEMFIDYKHGDNTLFNKLDKTYTKGGSYYLKNIFQNPNHNITFLNLKKKSLQDLFKLIDINKTELIENLEVMKKNQDNMFWILNDMNEDTNNLLNILYFNSFILKNLNNSSHILTFKNIYKIYILPTMGIIAPIIYFILPYLVIRLKFGIELSFTTFVKFIYNYYVNLNFGSMFGNSKLNMVRKVWMLFSILFYFNSIFNSIELSKLTHKINVLICNHINSVSKYVKAGYNLIEIIYDKTNFNNIFSNIDYNIKDIDYLLNFKNLENINSKNEYLNNFGEKLKLFKFLDKEKIKDFLNVTYLCDAIISLYLIKNEYNLSYPNFIKSNEPKIKIKGLIHPNINNAIKNDVNLDNKNNIIITGPNAAGKSTFIKAIAINILLSQTICMTFTDNINLTPFYYISSQINIVDDKGCESLFQAEMNRIIENINNVEECKKSNKFSILFLDELFNSTNIIEGVSGSYSICKKLCDITTNITLLTTHYNYLNKLEKNTNKFKNYKMESVQNNNIIKFPYKIKEGYSKQYIALELLKNNKELKNNKQIFIDAIDFKNNLFKISEIKIKEKRV
jgi:DNA mismatch repair ATPase MutS|tara:strand:+ start:708 stop:2588 length:1881 start_codon:yes stop_codon:yes gene_type:complete